MSKQVFLDFEARKKIINGVNNSVDAVKITLGPKGRPAVLGKSFGTARFTKDGVTVAKEIEFSDASENIGAQFVKEVCSKTVDAAGDGTTTASIMLQSILNHGLRSTEVGMNIVEVTKGMKYAADIIVNFLNSVASPIKGDSEKIKQVATISANGEKEIGKLISEAVTKIGDEGIITVDDGKSTQTELNVVDGMELDRGFISHHFANTDKQVCELENPYILIYDKKISSLPAILQLLENIVKSNRSLLIIAEDLEGIALSTLVVNTLNKVMKVCAIKAPGFGDRKRELSEDIAILTGGNVISEEIGNKLEDTKIEHLGQAEKITITKDKTTIIGGRGNKSDIENRCKSITTLINESTSDYDKNKLEERKSKLTNGIAVISVGGTTESEQKERKDRVEDAVQAVKAAIEEGILPGGGASLLHAKKQLTKEIESGKFSQDFNAGMRILEKSVAAPLIQNLINAGHDNAEVIVNEIYTSDDVNFGYDVLNSGYGDMMKLGIVDPKKSTRCAIEFSLSIATLILTSGCLIVDESTDSKESSSPAMPPMGGMGGMY